MCQKYLQIPQTGYSNNLSMRNRREIGFSDVKSDTIVASPIIGTPSHAGLHLTLARVIKGKKQPTLPLYSLIGRDLTRYKLPNEVNRDSWEMIRLPLGLIGLGLFVVI